MYLQQHAARTTTPSRTVTARVEQHDLDTRLQQHAVRTTTPARTRRPPAPPPASSSTTPLHALPAARRKNDDASSNSESRSSRSPTLCRNGFSSAPARRAAQIPGASECGGREDLPLAQEGASQRLRPRGRQCRRATRRPTAHARSHPPATRVTTHKAETPSTPYSRTCCTNTRPATALSRRTAGRGRTAADRHDEAYSDAPPPTRDYAGGRTAGEAYRRARGPHPSSEPREGTPFTLRRYRARASSSTPRPAGIERRRAPRSDEDRRPTEERQ